MPQKPIFLISYQPIKQQTKKKGEKEAQSARDVFCVCVFVTGAAARNASAQDRKEATRDGAECPEVPRSVQLDKHEAEHV